MYSPLAVVIYAAFCLVPSYFVGCILYNLLFHPLHSFPGPRSWAATRIPWLRSSLSGRNHVEILDLHLKYGDVVRVAPDELSYTTAAAWKDVYAHRPGHEEFGKHPLSQPVTVNGVPSIVGATRENHSRYRRLLSHAFSERALREQEPLIISYTDLLIRKLSERAGQEPLNMLDWYNWTTFDMIGDLGFGEPFHCLDTATTHPWIAFVYGNVKAIPFVGLFRRYHLYNLVELLLPKKLLEARRGNYDYAKDKLTKRMELDKDRGDFLDNLLKFEYPKGMTKEEMVSTSSSIVLAGSETTATLLSGATFYLLRNPLVLEKLVREIRGKFSSPEEIDFINLQQLEYLAAVLEESLRIYPPVPNGQPRVVPKGGDTVLGKYLPEGSVVTVQHYPSYRSPTNFHQPNAFIPERFLKDCDPIFQSDDRAVLQPFTVGPRGCIGRNLAYFEMRLILARVLFAFDLELDEKTGDWADQRAFNLWEKKPLWVKIKPAEHVGGR